MPWKQDTDTRVFFYEQEFYVLSNFAAFRLRWKDIDFDTSEHAYHWEKFAPPFSRDGGMVQDLILQARSAHEAFKIAEKYSYLRRPDWQDVRVAIMRDILQAKAAQHEYVRRKLLETGRRTLIEDSWRDDYWGWGEGHMGANMMGVLWMEIRTRLREKLQESPHG